MHLSWQLSLSLTLFELAHCVAVDSETLPKGVVSFPLSKSIPQEQAGLWRRADDVSLGITNGVSMYTASLFIGSNNQNVTVMVDTGSSDLWVMSVNNPYCASSASTRQSSSAEGTIKCSQNTQFNPSQSDTFTMNSTTLSLSYGDGSFANGSYCQDTISYGGATIKNANFAVANETSSSQSVWGIGLAGLESTSRYYDEKGNYYPTYSNLPMQMKEQGIIQQNAYSLWLNDLQATSGTLLFGGVDHSRYEGTLQTVPLLRTYPQALPNQMLVKLNDVSIYRNSTREKIIECTYPALLDSGTTYMMVPIAFMEVIVRSVDGSYGTNGECYVSCGLSGGLSFDFSGIKIDVPFSQMEFPLSTRGDLCQLGILPNGNSLILGETFLRSAYVVYDLENYEIALAPFKSGASQASVEAISSGIPKATQASGYSSTDVDTASISTTVATFIKGAASADALSHVSTKPIPSEVSASNAASRSLPMVSTTAPFSQSQGGSEGGDSSHRNDNKPSSQGRNSSNNARFTKSNSVWMSLMALCFAPFLEFLLYL